MINNNVYRSLGHAWWSEEEGTFAALRYFVHPARFGYLTRVLAEERMGGGPLRAALDVGCGGGFMAEDLARAGFQVTGIDSAAETAGAARTHAAVSELNISYVAGIAEALPFPEVTFDIAICCDVLEHVADSGRVVGEVARVLKPGGLFFYETINRTTRSWLMAIQAMQEWRSTAFVEPCVHEWRRFLKPAELVGILARNGLRNQETRGLSPRRNLVANWLDLRRRAQGKITLRELGRRLAFRESGDTSVSYLGYAIK